MNYARIFNVIETLHKISPPEDGSIVYVSEEANTMDISRSAFPSHTPVSVSMLALTQQWAIPLKAALQAVSGAPWSLGWEVGCQEIAEICRGKGFPVRTPEDLARATDESFMASVPIVLNVIIESRKTQKLGFAWQNSSNKTKKGEAKL
ncbi:hypothetical protein LZ554_002827 [Drepanopeziza brunnea f. sp. 'monogermtubi']|nr:hypothetical protein LZ554_002827 [Drepanopeziza brunnea f. sp. 'monogermtubi']